MSFLVSSNNFVKKTCGHSGGLLNFSCISIFNKCHMLLDKIHTPVTDFPNSMLGVLAAISDHRPFRGDHACLRLGTGMAADSLSTFHSDHRYIRLGTTATGESWH